MARYQPARVFLALTLAASVLALSAQGMAQGKTSRKPARSVVPREKSAGGLEVTPVEGPSTLHHLGLTIERSSMGWDGQWSAPPATVPFDRSHVIRAGSTAPFVLNGADLYRLSCRPCHKPDGSGAPPEINSLIGPVQSASAPWMSERMKAAGRPVDAAFIRQLTSRTEADLRKRLKMGGHNMPSFDHLSDGEITALRPYLDQLADVPAARRPRQIAESPDRIGELVVKGTCHICHDAAGDDKATTVLSGVIPSLASMPRQKTVAQFLRKVREGAPIPLGTEGIMSRGRMPAFGYLSEVEITAAYSYLIAYPPK